MKFSNTSSFSFLSSEYLDTILNQLIKDYCVVQIFYKKEKTATTSNLLIHLSNNTDTVKLKSSKWIDEVRKLYNINVHFIYSSRLHYNFSKGHPLVEYLCHPSAIIYQNKDLRDQLLIDRGWKKYRKKFNQYEDYFHHDHELKRIQIQKLIKEDAYNSVFTSYEELIVYDLQNLEDLYTIDRTNDININQRITILLKYLPEIKQYFVQKNRKEYFISELFTKAKKAIEGEDVVYDIEMFESLRIVEDALFQLIESRFYELKKSIKKQYRKTQKVEKPLLITEEKPKNENY